jgi:hypothetical protein
MKKLFFALFALTMVTASCRVLSRLTSSTQIEAGKSFVLGEGTHGSYSADVKNISKSDVEVFKSDSQGSMSSLGILAPGVKKNYAVPKNTKVAFKNNGSSLALIKINLVGDTNLSMGYADNTTIAEQTVKSNAMELPKIKIKVTSKSAVAKDYTVRGPAAQPFSFGITLGGGSKRFKDTLPVGTQIEDGTGKVLYTFGKADDKRLVSLD